MKSYYLTMSLPDDTNQRKAQTFYYVDSVRVSRERYEALNVSSVRKDCFLTRRSDRGRWLHSHYCYH